MEIKSYEQKKKQLLDTVNAVEVFYFAIWGKFETLPDPTDKGGEEGEWEEKGKKKEVEEESWGYF